MRGYPAGTGASVFDIRGYAERSRYHQPNITCATCGNFTPVVDKLYAYPIFFPVSTLIANLHMYVAGGRAGSGFRMGIYDSISGQATPSGADTYPNNLLYDGGQIDGTAAGVKTSACNYTFPANVIHYLVSVFFNGGAGVNPVNAIGDSCQWALLGEDSTFTADTGNCWRATFAYGALPATFPTAGSEALFTNRGPVPFYEYG